MLVQTVLWSNEITFVDHRPLNAFSNFNQENVPTFSNRDRNYRFSADNVALTRKHRLHECRNVQIAQRITKNCGQILSLDQILFSRFLFESLLCAYGWHGYRAYIRKVNYIITMYHFLKNSLLECLELPCTIKGNDHFKKSFWLIFSK